MGAGGRPPGRREPGSGQAAGGAGGHLWRARLEATGGRERADGEARRLAEGEGQHAKLDALSIEARHLGQLAELLSAFRNTVVATVGPRLAVQAAELFGELTDSEYDRLEV